MDRNKEEEEEEEEVILFDPVGVATGEPPQKYHDWMLPSPFFSPPPTLCRKKSEVVADKVEKGGRQSERRERERRDMSLPPQ